MKTCLLFFLFYLLLPVNLFAQEVTPSDEVEKKIESVASYPGADTAWRNYLHKNLNSRIPLDKGAPDGKYTVTIIFAIKPNGSILVTETKTNHGYGMEAELKRLIEKSDTWKPAMRNGTAITEYRRQSVSFFVAATSFEILTDEPNILFTCIDNIIRIKIRKTKSSDLDLTISQGSIAPTDNGKFLIRVSEPGRAVITVYDKKNNKNLGAVSIEVKAKN